MKRKQIPAKIRSEIYRKYGGRCAYCGQKIKYKEMQIDHMKPLAKGGADSRENYMPSCYMCNHFKNNLTIEKFREQIEISARRLSKKMYIYKLALRHGRITENHTPIRFYFEKELQHKTEPENETNIGETVIWQHDGITSVMITVEHQPFSLQRLKWHKHKESKGFTNDYPADTYSYCLTLNEIRDQIWSKKGNTIIEVRVESPRHGKIYQVGNYFDYNEWIEYGKTQGYA